MDEVYLDNKLKQLKKMTINDKNFENILYQALKKNSKYTIDCLKKNNYFNYWKNKEINQGNGVTSLINMVLKYRDIISDEEEKYLREKLSYSKIAQIYLEEIDKIQNKISYLEKKRKSRKINGIKLDSNLTIDFMNIFELLCARNKYTLVYEKKNPYWKFDDLFKSFGFEEIASGISFLIFFDKKFDDHKDILLTDRKFINDYEVVFFELIQRASMLMKMVEIEAMIDLLDFDFIVEDNKLTINNLGSELERTSKLGYIFYDLQRIVTNQKFKQEAQYEDSITLEKIVEILHINDYVERKGKGLDSRITLRIDSHFLELFSQVESIDIKEDIHSFVNEWNVKDFSIKNITESNQYTDLVIFYMHFKLIERLLLKFFFDNNISFNKKQIGTFSFYVEKDVFYKLFSSRLSSKQIDELINVLSIKKNRQDTDLFYSPFFISKNKIAIFPHILSITNYLRNFIKISNKEKNKFVSNNNGRDNLTDVAFDIFNNIKEFKVYKEVYYNYEGKTYEIDILLVSENEIFIIECKNSLYPTSVYETRTILENLSKAQRQIDRHIEYFKGVPNFSEINLDLEEIKNKRVNGLIIHGNRLFVGLKKFKYPIRFLNELQNVIEEGNITLQGDVFCTNPKNYSKENILKQYIDEQNSLVKIKLDAMNTYEEKFRFGVFDIHLYQSRLDVEKLIFSMKKYYT